MLIKAVTTDYIHDWRTPAKEMEPIFQYEMAGTDGLQEYMKKN